MDGWKVLLGVILVLLISGCSYQPTDVNETFIDYSKPRFTTTTIEVPMNQTDTYLPPIQPKNDDYLIGAWNIQIFGKMKAENNNIYPHIVDVLDDYDIIGIEEIRDKTLTVSNKLAEIPNYNIITSQRLGRTKSKEQYAFLYSNRVQLLNRATYEDSGDIFEREPLVAQFQIKNYTMAIILIHTKPTDAKNEIKHLKDVVKWTEDTFNEDDIFIMGDLNSDCSYFSGTPLPQYTNLINNSVDTTIGRSNCAYDRIIVTEMNDNIISWGVDNLTEETSGNQELMEAMSDHFPIKLTIKP